MGIVLACGQNEPFKRNIPGVNVNLSSSLLKILALQIIGPVLDIHKPFRPDKAPKSHEAAVKGPTHLLFIEPGPVKKKLRASPVCRAEQAFQFSNDAINERFLRGKKTGHQFHVFCVSGGTHGSKHSKAFTSACSLQSLDTIQDHLS